MSPFLEVAGAWPVRAIVIGGAILLVGRLLMLVVKQPAKRGAIGLLAVLASLIAIPLATLPGWLRIAVPATVPVQVASATPLTPTFNSPDAIMNPSAALNAELTEVGDSVPASKPQFESPLPVTAVEAQPQTSGASAADAVPTSPTNWLLGLYGFVAVALLVKLLIGHWGLLRLWRNAQSPPPWLESQFGELARTMCPRARLRVSNRAIGPICFGVLRPRVLLPTTMLVDGDREIVRAVLVHELSHLSRRDPLAGWMLGITRAIHFVWPWLSGIRREVRLAQEQIADAAAAECVDSPVEYAELLIRMSRTRPAPLGAAGVRGSNSELFRRVTMLLQKNERIETRCPRSWKLAIGGGLTAFAILAAGLYVQPRETLAADPKEAPKPAPKVDPIKQLIEKLKKDAGDDPEKAKQIEDLEKSLKAKPAPDPTPVQIPNIAPPILDELPEDELLRELMQAQGNLLKQLEQMLGQVQGGRPGGLAFGPDGLLRPARPASGARLGIRVEKPNEVLATQLELPNGQGLVCVDVPADSNAAKIGIKSHDILLEVAGKPVPNEVQPFVDALKGIKPDTAIDIVVLRKGKKETLKGVKLPEAKEVAVDMPALVFPKIELPMPIVVPIEAPPLPGIPGLPEVRVPPIAVGPGETVRVEQVNDAFTIFYTKNGVKVTIAGSKEGGTPKAESIEVEVNGKTTKAESIEKLPKEYQELAKSAMKAIR